MKDDVELFAGRGWDYTGDLLRWAVPVTPGARELLRRAGENPRGYAVVRLERDGQAAVDAAAALVRARLFVPCPAGGGRGRSRGVYRLTEAGREAASAVLAS